MRSLRVHLSQIFAVLGSATPNRHALSSLKARRGPRVDRHRPVGPKTRSGPTCKGKAKTLFEGDAVFSWCRRVDTVRSPTTVSPTESRTLSHQPKKKWIRTARCPGARRIPRSSTHRVDPPPSASTHPINHAARCARNSIVLLLLLNCRNRCIPAASNRHVSLVEVGEKKKSNHLCDELS